MHRGGGDGAGVVGVVGVSAQGQAAIGLGFHVAVQTQVTDVVGVVDEQDLTQVQRGGGHRAGDDDIAGV